MVERGLAETRSQAQALVLAGKVPGHAKAGEQVDEAAEIEVKAGPRFVSRGGEKLANALATFAIGVEGEDCLDVGYGQLHQKLRVDPRVTVMERVNVRELDCADLPFAPTFLTCDVSFISLAKALPPALACAAPGWRALVLVKPQFEAGRAEVGKGGVVRHPEVHRRVVDGVSAQAPDWGAHVEGAADSGLPGPKGNREFFVYVRDA